MKQRLSHIGNKITRRAWKFTDGRARRYWHDFPFGSAPRADKAAYKALWEAERKSEYPEIDAFEKEAGFAVHREWFDNLALHTQIVIKDSPLCYQHGRVLYAALRAYIAKAGPRMLTILETGTARGFSSVVMAKALYDTGTDGKILTFDLLPHDTAMYWNCIDDHEGPKTRRQLLAPWHDIADPYIIFMENDSRIGIPRMATGRIDFAFLDGAHTYNDVMLEFGMVAARQQAGDVIVFDDYSVNIFPGLVKAVDEGCERWGYSKQVIRSGGERAYVIARKAG